MGDEIEIVNLFGRLALDETLQITTDKVEEQTAIVEAVRVLLTAINNKAITIDTAHIQGEVSVTNLPTDGTKETTLLMIKSLSEDLKTLTTTMKDLVIASNNTLAAISTKIVNQDTKHIEGSVSIVNTPEVTVNFPTTQQVSVTNQVDPLTNEELRALPIEVNVVASTGGGLTDDQLRQAPVPVSLTSAPLAVNAAKDTSIIALFDKMNEVLAQMQTTLIKSDTDNVSITAGDLRLLSALKAITRQSYDASNNLRVTNTPVGTQTVSVSGTANVAFTNGVGVGSLGLQGSGVVLSRLSFYRMLDRISIT